MELERTPIYEIFDRKQSGNQLYIMRERFTAIFTWRK